MVLRKLTVLVLPLGMLLALCLLIPVFSAMDAFFGSLLLGSALGVALGLLLPLAGGPAMLLNRNLLYTAVTRAKAMVYCLGHRDTVARMVRTVQSRRRFTSLSVRLQEV